MAVLAVLLAFAPAALAAPGDTLLVSQSATAQHAIAAAMSPDGRWVAYTLGTDVWVRDMHHATGFALVGAGEWPSLSADGRYVAYENAGLVTWRDRHGGTVHTFGTSNGEEPGPSISADGRYVAYVGTDGVVYRWFVDGGTGPGQIVSIGANAASSGASISADGSRVAFDDGVSVFRWKAEGGTDTVSPGRRPSISADGTRIAFESDNDTLAPGDDNFSFDVFLWTAGHHGVQLMSRMDGPNGLIGDNESVDASIAPDGGAVAFESIATNFALDEGFGTDVYVRELAFHQTHLASRAHGPGGAPGDGSSYSPSLGNGLVVAFESDADNLSGADDDAFAAVHRRELGGAPENLVAPSIAQNGDVLTCAAGSWRWPVTSFTFAWRLEGAAVGAGPEYRPGEADAGNTLTCDVTAANGAGSNTASSAAFAVPAAGASHLPPPGGVSSPFASLTESFNGTARRDTLIGSIRANTIRGRGGNDVILGGGGDDRLYGDAGNDAVDGELGDDLVDGGAGADRLTGGDGRDRIVGRAGADRIDARDGARDRVDCGKGRDRVVADRSDRLTNCERVRRRRS